MKMLIFTLLLFGCYHENNKNWKSLLSSLEWYRGIKSKEKRLEGKIYDKGTEKWIIDDEIETKSGVVKDGVLSYKKGEEYNRFLFETGFSIYDIYLEDFWAETKMIKFLKLNKPKEAKRLFLKKFEIIGKERIVFEKGIKRKEFVPRMIREK